MQSRKMKGILLAGAVAMTVVGLGVGVHDFNFAPIAIEADETEEFVIVDGVLTAYNGDGGDVVIPEGVTSIRDGVFSGCSSLTSIKIPASVKVDAWYGYLGNYWYDSGIFSGCDNLSYIEVDPENTTCASQDGVLYNVDKTVLMYCPRGKEGVLEIPEGTTMVAFGAVSDCVKLTDITFPVSLAEMGYSTFDGCTGLTRLVIRGNSLDVQYESFKGCNNLVSVEMEEGVESISEFAFTGCTNLKYVSMPASMKSILWEAFKQCTSLENVEIPSGVTGFEGIFTQCDSLSCVIIPETVTSIFDINGEGYGEETNVTIYGWSDSYAETYAEKYGLSFVPFTNAVDSEALITSLGEETILFHADLADFSTLPDAALEVIGETETTVYDLYLTQNGELVQPTDTVEVFLPIPEGYDPLECVVYYVDEQGNMTDMNAEPCGSYLKFATTHFSTYIITEGEVSALSGDVNADGVVDMKDVVLMKRHIAGWTINGDVTVADVNADGAVDMKDVVLVKRYIAGWDVILGD